MKLYQMVVRDVMRRKRRVLYAALGVVIGTMTVVGILTIALAGEARIYSQAGKRNYSSAEVQIADKINQRERSQ